jgi:membrane associated rhomboid family serine protease
MNIFEEIAESFKKGGMLVKLIYINLAVFLVYNLLFVFFFLAGAKDSFNLTNYLAVPAHIPNFLARPWTILTYMFFHEGFLHILFNLLWLYWLGQIFVRYKNEKELLGVYIMGGIAGAALYMLFYNVFPVFAESLPISYALGASAAVYAVVFATVTYNPNFTLNLMFIGPVKLKYIAAFLIVLDVISIAGNNAGGHIAHLGGAIFGYLFIVGQRSKVNLILPVLWAIGIWENYNPFRRKPKMKVDYRHTADDMEYNRVKVEKQKEIDIILDKISHSGYDSLSADEKKTLFNMKGK